MVQLVDELLAYWRLEDAEATLEELEDLLIVSSYLLTTNLYKNTSPLPLRPCC